MDNYTQMFDVCIILAGLYMLYCAITGKGSLYRTDNIKKGQEESYQKTMRRLCLVGGIFAVPQGLLDFFKIQPLALILFLLFCAVVVAFCILSVKYGDFHRIKN